MSTHALTSIQIDLLPLDDVVTPMHNLVDRNGTVEGDEAEPSGAPRVVVDHHTRICDGPERLEVVGKFLVIHARRKPSHKDLANARTAASHLAPADCATTVCSCI